MKSVVIATLPADRFIYVGKSLISGQSLLKQGRNFATRIATGIVRMRTPTGGFTRKMICKQPNKIGHKRKRAETDERLSEVYKTAALPLSQPGIAKPFTRYNANCYPNGTAARTGSRGGSFRQRSYQGDRVAGFFSRASFCASAI